MHEKADPAKPLFLTAVELPSEAARRSFLMAACGGNLEVRRRVEELLAAHAAADNPLDQIPHMIRAGAAGLKAELRAEPSAGEAIGEYTLLEKLGEGGMGTVWAAEQGAPVCRAVALKLVKPGMDSRQVLRRFDDERRALALMDHANIAKVFHAGTTPDGRPYFAMELVNGVPITRYCDDRNLSTRERLELFIPVCHAIQHAHQKGVIHRDVKPSNVLVSLQDGLSLPKVIDFGVAKALHRSPADQTAYTEPGVVVGTLEYMAPEQAELSAVEVDTRADIYALGAVLYELLTGSTPLDRNRIASAGIAVAMRFIQEEEPQKPSDRLSGSNVTLEAVARQRRSSVSKLAKEVRGDLDWIVMKCLEKDRTRRYETADALACDLRRHLEHEPVQACAASAAYRLKKSVRRHKGPLAAVAVVLLTLIAGIVGTASGLVRVERARQAEAERARGERLAKEEAQKRLAQVGKATEILASMFRDLGPLTADDEGVATRDLIGRRLVAAAQELEGESVGDLLVEARLKHALGISLEELGHPQAAEQVLEKARHTRERLLGSDHLDTAATNHHLAMLYRERGEYDKAEALLTQAVATRTARLGADHRDTLTSRHCLALLYASRDDYPRAEELLRSVLKARSATLGTDHPDTLQTQHRLALLYRQQWDLASSEATYKDVLRVRIEKLGHEHLDTIASKEQLAALYHVQGKFDEAEAVYKEALAVRLSKLGADHPDTLASRQRLASLQQWRGNYGVAEGLFREVLAARTVKLGAHHPDTLVSRDELARAYHFQRKFELAEREYMAVIAARTARLGAGDLSTIGTKDYLAALYLARAMNDRAEPLLREVLAVRTAKLGAVHPATMDTTDTLARLCWSTGKRDETIRLLEGAFAARRAKVGADDPETLGRQVTLGTFYCEAGRFAEGIDLIEEVRDRGRDNPHPAWVRSALVIAYVRAGKTAEATLLVAERVQDARAEFPADSDELAAALVENGTLLVDARAYRDAEPLLLEGYEIFASGLERTLNQPGDMQRDAVGQLVRLYEAVGRPDEAARWRQRIGVAPSIRSAGGAE